MPVTDVYSSVNDGEEAYFLDGLNRSVKVLSIVKKEYNGKIYDVDVGNDVVLVRRLGDDKLEGDGGQVLGSESGRVLGSGNGQA